MLKFPLVEVNKLSKIYKQKYSDITFESVESAKQFFLTAEAIDTYDQHCYNQNWQLINDKKALHWTVSFMLDTKPNDPNYIPNSDKWRDIKAGMTENRKWFVEEHWPIIIHDAENLY